MKNQHLHRGLLCGSAASLLTAAAAALAMSALSGAPRSAETVLGILAVLSGTVFSLCCAALLEQAFHAASGVTLSDYFQRLHGGMERGGRA